LFYAIQNHMTEWSYRSGTAYDDPFNDVELDVVITAPDGHASRVPAFWAGEGTWRVRYASPQVGLHRFVTACSVTSDEALHGQEGAVAVRPYAGDQPLYTHGPLRVAADGRHLRHADGTPFFWLGDTWWMGLCERLRWPHDVRTLTADRAAKGFTVAQIVAGLYPDMPAFDPRGANEGGFPWEAGYARINPAYFDAADLRLAWIVDAGLVPCLVGAWGYFARWMGVERMKRHWRYLIARYGAYPVVWCLAGEATMPYYLTEDRDGDVAFQRQAWTEVAAYVRETDPYHHPVTIHPTSPASARDQLANPALLDLDLLQTGHSDRDSLPATIERVRDSVAATPPLPVINSEVCYEGILGENRQEIQRLMFWSCVLSGAAGHTYGANGLWQVNTRERPYGPSPHGSSWGDTPWEEAYQLPGAAQIALGKRLLERYPWWRFEPHQEWVSVRGGTVDYVHQLYAAGISGKVRVVYLPWNAAVAASRYSIAGLETGHAYQASFVNPATGREYPCGTARADEAGEWPIPRPPIFQDWVLVLDRPTAVDVGGAGISGADKVPHVKHDAELIADDPA